MAACDRCGNKILPQDHELKFQVHYKPLGVGEPPWRELTLCEDCQKDLRFEFYQRGLVVNAVRSE